MIVSLMRGKPIPANLFVDLWAILCTYDEDDLPLKQGFSFLFSPSWSLDSTDVTSESSCFSNIFISLEQLPIYIGTYICIGKQGHGMSLLGKRSEPHTGVFNRDFV